MLLLILQLAMLRTAPAWSPAGTVPPEINGPQHEPDGSPHPHDKGSCIGLIVALLRERSDAHVVRRNRSRGLMGWAAWRDN